MKILHVVPTYLPAVRYGGPIQSVHGLARAQVGQGHDVQVLTTNIDGDGVSPVPVDSAVSLDGVEVRYFHSPMLRRLSYAPALARHLRGNLSRYDVVHLHSVFLWPTSVASRLAADVGIPSVLSPRGMLVPELMRRKSRWVKAAWLALFERRNLARAAAIHFTSVAEQRDFERLGLRAQRDAVIPNGVDLPAPSPEPREPGLLVCVGRLSWKKGLDRLIRALAALPEARLVLAGGDDEGCRHELEHLAAQSGVAPRVSFTGAVSPEQRDRLLARAQAFVLPSHSENFGNAVAEAMAAGCPVVVTPQVGLADTVATAGAGLVSPGDPTALAEALRRLLGDAALCVRCGEAGRRAAREMSWNSVATRMESLYRTIAGA